MQSTEPNPPTAIPKLKITLRLLHQGEIAMGPGKAELLEAIQQTGSISAAGKSMNMSYRRAWLLVDTMNRCFSTPLVTASKGGKSGGGAKLTPFGQQVLDQYYKMNNAVNHSAQAYLPLFSGLMADLDEDEESSSQENAKRSTNI
ncbi:MAG: LysR family transcriptional regulator [Methylococcaceae bacterium]|jgi:molybdate transport system regulatory protein